jgi:hypothetical protein
MSNQMHNTAFQIKTGLLRRLGFAGFLFFLLKGLAWLSLPALLTILH